VGATRRGSTCVGSRVARSRRRRHGRDQAQHDRVRRGTQRCIRSCGTSGLLNKTATDSRAHAAISEAGAPAPLHREWAPQTLPDLPNSARWRPSSGNDVAWQNNLICRDERSRKCVFPPRAGEAPYLPTGPAEKLTLPMSLTVRNLTSALDGLLFLRRGEPVSDKPPPALRPSGPGSPRPQTP